MNTITPTSAPASKPDVKRPTTSASTIATHLLEEGAAFEALSGERHETNGTAQHAERHEVIVIGGGQAGLSVGYHLAQRGIPFVILDAHPRVGDAWRQRWDTLRLFSPARLDALDGLPFPGDPDAFPTKDEMADYLEAYAQHFRLPVRVGMRVDHMSRAGDRYVVTANGQHFEAPHVVIAMSTYQRPRVPAFAAELDPAIVQIHSLDYHRPSQLPDGDVLVVGAANSGAEIAMDLVRTGHRVVLSGQPPGQVPFDIKRRWVRRTIVPVLFRGVFHRLLTVDTPLGRRVRPTFVSKGTPLIRTRSGDLRDAGVALAARTTGVQDGMPVLADGTRLDVRGVVWCTGFDMGGTWIDRPVFDDHGDPIQKRGVVTGEPGLYFVGTHFLYAASSAMIHGVGRDASRVAEAIAARRASAPAGVPGNGAVATR